MTVAAVILAASAESALADAEGLPSVRRIADAAWSGGATPIVVVADDPAGGVAEALVGAAVTLAEPGPHDGGPAAQIARGISVALAEIHDASGALVWPATMTWVGPETVTSMIEAHGTNPGTVLTPRYDGRRGWPVLVPAVALDTIRRIGGDQPPDTVVETLLASGLREVPLELGDPGAIHDRSVARDDLPPYQGPSEPAAGHVHEWGSAAAELSDDAPLEGPALAPYGQAAAEVPDQPG